MDTATANAGAGTAWSAYFVAISTLGLVETALAFSWGHRFGFIVGISAAAIGATAVYLRRRYDADAFSKPDRYEKDKKPSKIAASLGDPQTWLVSKAVVWLMNAILVYLVLLIAIRLISYDTARDTFPDACPTNKLQGCSRLALNNTHGFETQQPLHLTSPIHDVHSALLRFVHHIPQSTLLYQSLGDESFIHVRTVSGFWGFADDLFIRSTCDGAMAIVELQGQLRLGISDLGTNRYHIKVVVFSMDEAEKSGLLPFGSCS